MSIDKFFTLLSLFILCNSSVNAQDENVMYNDSLTKNLFQIKKDYSKRIFESTYYTIQIYFGSLNQADSILNDFKENFEEVKSNLIFETPNYKVRIGEYKDINVASQKLEGVRRIYPGSFIIKLSEL
jgi:hypothetical protein|tara:strand:+ start:84 stop:464 length:381 start_codon:yes stop_codon:yes gene_type:complete